MLFHKQTTVICLVALASFSLGFFIGQGVERRFHPPTTTTIYTSDADGAKGALITFLASLYEKKYDTAASVYGGSYTELQRWNPTIDPMDFPTLWKLGCEQNGYQCLEIRNLAFDSQPNQNTFVFHVWLSNPDKVTEYRAADGTSLFSFTVTKTDQGEYKVVTAPVYAQ